MMAVKNRNSIEKFNSLLQQDADNDALDKCRDEGGVYQLNPSILIQVSDLYPALSGTRMLFYSTWIHH